jgi:DNA-binding XRE family transcriptional regulator
LGPAIADAEDRTLIFGRLLPLLTLEATCDGRGMGAALAVRPAITPRAVRHCTVFDPHNVHGSGLTLSGAHEVDGLAGDLEGVEPLTDGSRASPIVQFLVCHVLLFLFLVLLFYHIVSSWYIVCLYAMAGLFKLCYALSVDKMSIGKRIQAARERAVYGRSDLAKAAGLTYEGLYLIETGKRTPRPTTIRNIAAALEMSPRDLVGE